MQFDRVLWGYSSVQNGHDNGDSRLMHQCPGTKHLYQLHKRGAYNNGAVAGGRRMRACD